MVENNPEDFSDEGLKRAASESVQHDESIRERVRDLTLMAFQKRRMDPEQVKRVVRSMTEGITLGASQRTGDVRNALADALGGLDAALMKSAEATHLALREMASKGREFSQNELKVALENLRKLEEDFLSTVSTVADAANDKVRDELRELVTHARRGGTDTGRQIASVMGEFAHRMTNASIETTLMGIEVARELSGRVALAASGFLSALAEALRTSEAGKDDRQDDR